MKHIVKGLMLCIAIGLLFVSCEMLQEDETIEITGDWLDAYGGTLSVTEDKIVSSFGSTVTWIADIAKFDNENWNAGDTGSGDCGYAVIKYTQASEYVPDSQDKYMVLRWQDLATAAGVTTLSYAEGYGTYFDNEDSAEAGASDAAGYFASFTDGVVRQ